MLAEVQAQSALAGLEPAGDNARRYWADLMNDTSAAAPHRLLLWVVAVAMSLLTRLWDRAKAEQQAIADASEAGTDAWAKASLLEYQHGDPVVVRQVGRTVTWGYEVVDAAKRVIAYCVVRTQPGRVRVVIAADQGGVPVPVTGAQLDGARAFMARIKPVGTNAVIETRGADVVRYRARIYYDGQLEQQVFAELLAEAQAAYGRSGLRTDGVFEVLAWQDALQKVPGFVNIDLEWIEGQPEGGTGWSRFRMQYPCAGAAVVFGPGEVTYQPV